MTEEWNASDDAEAALEGMGLDEPIQCALTFLSAFTDDDGLTPHGIVTPESRDSWGDFKATAAFLAAARPFGVASYPIPAIGALDVAYVRLIPDVADTYQVVEGHETAVLAFLTLVWRPEVGFWMVHALTKLPLPASEVPRTSPGRAPRYTTPFQDR